MHDTAALEAARVGGAQSSVPSDFGVVTKAAGFGFLVVRL